jgi:predicted HNH restriction endonuclease
MSKRKGISNTPNEDLSLYSLHCRYSIHYGLSMKEAADLWHTMKDKYPDRESHMNALLLSVTSKSTDNIEQTTKLIIQAQEGEEYLQEITIRKRNGTLTSCRLETDNYTCQYCGFNAKSVFSAEDKGEAFLGVIVEVHHIDPVSEGIRQTTLDDLVTLCPLCHRIIHAIGRSISSDKLGLSLLQKYYKRSNQATQPTGRQAADIMCHTEKND